ncbi:MAG: type 4a pilus biogenesis protein PilO [bacterium]|nr:type 4a pilus biogenesis protein PilO [bacterium]
MKRRLTIYTVTSLLLILAWFLLIYSPTVQRKQALNLRINEAEQQLADFNRTMEELPQYLKASNNLERFKNELNSSLYAKSDILELLEQITGDAVDNGLTVVEISPPVKELLLLNRATDLETEPQFLNITLSLSGKYLDFGKYVGHLETTPYFRKINSCTARGAREVQPEVSFTLSFKALIGAARGKA